VDAREKEEMKTRDREEGHERGVEKERN